MIKLTQFRYGPGYFQAAGTELQLSPEQEQELIDQGAAVPIPAPPKPPENDKPQDEEAS